MGLKTVKRAAGRNTIRPSNGQKYFVPDPTYVAVGPKIIIVVDRENKWSEIDPRLIVELGWLVRWKDPLILLDDDSMLAGGGTMDTLLQVGRLTCRHPELNQKQCTK